MNVSNAKIYGLNESIRASKYPMSTDVDSLTDEVTVRTSSLGTAMRGSGHDQFLTGIVVQFDLNFSIKAWIEAERYHFLDFVSSQSTMHRITSMDISKQCNEYVAPEVIQYVERLVAAYRADPTADNYLKVLYNVPTGLTYTARMTTNYRQLKTIYAQRRTHRLPEWREFCKWLETLPNSEWITT